ncbi:histidine kinase dimerization/phospho-acceptor domain-containing protein [Reichenbachiella sp. MALMAid0571]|uniref:PorY family sensor histidine kinase n=1 Tax=Reichenbachiella sp. MALMAid0571 TaxID=3143939 RepID=UPI0032DE8C2D
MKLLSLTNRYYLASILPILLVGGFLAYIILRGIINHEFNEKLFAEKKQFIHEWHTYKNLRETLYLNVGDKIEVKAVEYDPEIGSILSDTIMYDSFEKKELPYRLLKFSHKFDDRFYLVTITKSMLPTEDLIQGVGQIILILIAGLVLSLGFVSRAISKKIWTPFNNTIFSLKNYQIATPANINFDKTTIDEFKELNRVLIHMIDKSRKDYVSLKEFTENASHEIQTPLAIIKSKAELLLQNGNLDQENLEDVGKIYEAANRLSRLKQGLTMLAKMDNNQFEEVEPIEVAELITSSLENYEELIAMKEISLTKTYNSSPTLVLNNTLAYVLVTNLINNAIKHNLKQGSINIILNNDELIIENPGQPLSDDPENYFNRFKKGSAQSDSSGLGLALIKKICDIYDMRISYTVNEAKHRIAIQF